MRLDAIGVLFSSSWRRLQKHFMPATQIFIAPLILILIGKLLLAHNTGAAFLLGIIIEFLGAIFSILASIALVSMFGKGTDFAASYRTGFKLFWSAIWISILTAFATLGGFVMLIIPGIMLIFQLAFTNFALVLDGKRGIGALAQSREYVKGYWWAFVGRALLLLICLGAAMLIFFIPATLLFGYAAGQIVYAILLLIFTPFSIAYEYEIYENLHRLKPDAAEAAAKSERGFLKVAMVVGIIGAFLLAILIAVGAVFLPKAMSRWHAEYPNGYSYSYGYGYPSMPMMPGTSTMSGSSSTMPGEENQIQISPVSGRVGTTITISGGEFSGTNTIFMKGLVAAKNVAASSDGTLSFVVPSSLAPDCSPGEACPQFLLSVTPGDYPVSVMDSQGTIPVGTFTVTGTALSPGTPAADGSD